MVSRTRIVVTGLGCISPLGHDIPSTWNGLLNGESGVGPITLFEASEFKTKFAAEVKEFDPVSDLGAKLARRTDRFTQFAIVVTEQALKKARVTVGDQNRDRIGVIFGTGIGGIGTLIRETETYLERGPRWVSPFLVPMMLPDTAAGQVAIEFGMRGPNMAVVTACASSANAIGEAAEVIRRGAADLMVAGGAESAIVPVAVAGFNVMNAISTRNDDPQAASRPFDQDRDGFVVGEGAAALILESLEHAQARGAAILAEVAGYGATNDAYHISAPAENGAGAAQCMRVALAQAGLEPSAIDYINAHGTSTELNDVSETAAIKTVFGEEAYAVPISSTKSMTGHLLGAAGALESTFCILALRDGVMPPTINLEHPDPACDLDYVPHTKRAATLHHVMSNSFGFGGHNATLIFRHPNEMDGQT
jgi:3-oxoacyl-[acyl-carrier-protein] synthase II